MSSATVCPDFFPAAQYGSPGTSGTYDYWDTVTLHPPVGAQSATIELKYQPTSWEYMQFLWLANGGQNAFLAEEGVNMLQAWLNTGMAAPHTMASATWGQPGGCTPTGVSEATCNGVDDDCDGSIDEDYVNAPTSCGVGECAATGTLSCVAGVEVNNCTPGTPGAEGPVGDVSCSDGLDNDCDGNTDAADADCQQQVDCSQYGDATSCRGDSACRWDNKNGVCINK